jgi:hypothetical protein
MANHKLLALKINRRSISAVVFADTHIDYTQVRTLVADEARSLSSALGFVRWIARAFAVSGAALEHLPAESRIRRAVLSRVIAETLRSAAVPVWEVEKRDLLAAFASPPLRTRKELGEVVKTLWPMLASDPNESGMLDAAAAGLYLQIERLLETEAISL